MKITIVFGTQEEVSAAPLKVIFAGLDANIVLITSDLGVKFIQATCHASAESEGPVDGHILILTNDPKLSADALHSLANLFPEITSIRHIASWEKEAMRGVSTLMQEQQVISDEAWDKLVESSITKNQALRAINADNLARRTIGIVHSTRTNPIVSLTNTYRYVKKDSDNVH